MALRIKKSNPKQTRGVVLILLVASTALVMVMGALTVDRSFLTYQRVQAQDAADMDALATGWLLARDGGSNASSQTQSADEAVGVAVAADNGFTALPATYPDPDAGHVGVHVSLAEPTFFSGIVGFHGALVEANATAIFAGISKAPQPPGSMGYIHGEGFNYSAYGPQDSIDRGDKIDAEYTSIPTNMALNSWFGTDSADNTGAAFGPADYPYGSVYEFDVPQSYSDQVGGQTIDFEIYDPDIYDSLETAGPSTYHSGKTWTDPNGRFDEFDHDPDGDTGTYSQTQSYKEDYLFTLWANAEPGSPHAVIVAQAVYGPNLNTGSPIGTDDEFNTNDHWTTPSGFSFNAASYLAAAEAAATGSPGTSSNAVFYISMQTTDGVNIGTSAAPVYSTGDPKHYGTGYNENGYLLRAGPPHTSDSQYSLVQATSQALTVQTTDGKAIAAKNANVRADLMDPYATVPTGTLDPKTGAKGDTYDLYWEDKYGGPTTGIVFSIDTPMSINANEQTGQSTVPIYFGYQAANPNSGGTTQFTFWGWDQDSAASGSTDSITYECWNNSSYTGSPIAAYTHTGVIGGNGEWGGTSQLGDTFSIKGYVAGWWIAEYNTGPSDNTTWYMDDNYNEETAAYVNLVSNTAGTVY